MNDQKSDGQSSCCDGGDCCQPSGTGESRRNNRWKILVFTSVILLAGVVSAYSLFWRNQGAVSSSCCPPGSAECATPCVVVAPIPGLDVHSVETDITLAVFLPAGCEFPQNAADAIHGVITDLEAKGTHVQMQYLTPTEPEYETMASRYMITHCPTVLVTTSGGSVVLAQEAISRDSILSIYERSRQPIPSTVTSAIDPAR